MPRRRPANPDALTPQQQQAVVVLAGGGTQEEAARAVGVQRSTVTGWMARAYFVAAVDAEVDAALAEARRRLRAAAPLAVSALLDVANDPDQPGAARVSAAKEVLNRIGLVEATEVRHAGHDGGPLPIADLAALSPEQLRALRAGASS